MAYFTAPAYYNLVREMPAGKGFADLVAINYDPDGSDKKHHSCIIEEFLFWLLIIVGHFLFCF